ncbi:MAG: L,D-transpeptidase family protein, partial [Paracoccaceae bacterium]|nr:L,D-transpeptidase family protein [Paracoccaceae bacterium]
MQVFLRLAISIVLLSLLAGCSSKFRSYDGPEVTKIIVFKEARAMHLMHQKTVLKSYRIDLGFEPRGHKTVSGDGKTPEGLYYIDRRNPKSEFHLSLGISYPNERDTARAEKLGKSPGGDIFIHGRGNPVQAWMRDWTWGCIAVTNEE